MTTVIQPITITLRLQAPGVTGAAFGTMLILVDEADGTGNDLNGERFVSYSSTTDTATAATAGYITTDTKALVDLAFSQSPAPSSVLVGRVDTASAETYPDGLTACLAAGAVFYALAIDSTTAAVQVAVGTAVEALEGYIFALASSDADWKTTGVPAAYSTVSGLEQVAAFYHDAPTAATGRPDIAWLASWLNVANPDSQSAPSNVKVVGISALTTDLTAAQAAFVLANGCNYVARYGPTTLNVAWTGQMLSTRPAYERLSADWVRSRLETAIINVMASQITLGRKLPMNAAGQGLIVAAASQVLQQGVDAGHFRSADDGGDDFTFAGESITTADITAQKLRFSGSAQFLSSALYVETTLDLYRS